MNSRLYMDDRTIAALTHSLAQNLSKVLTPLIERQAQSIEQLTIATAAQPRTVAPPTSLAGTNKSHSDIRIENVDIGLLATQLQQLSSIDYRALGAFKMVTEDQVSALRGVESLLAVICDQNPVKDSDSSYTE